jgi:hypothetical protein
MLVMVAVKHNLEDKKQDIQAATVSILNLYKENNLKDEQFERMLNSNYFSDKIKESLRGLYYDLKKLSNQLIK